MSREIQFIGSATGTLSADLTSLNVQAGDLIVVFTFRVSSTTAPSLAAGYTSIGVGSGFSCSERTGYLVAAGGETSTGTWANANILIAVVYRNHGGIGATSVGGGSSTTINYPTLNMDVPDRASHLLAFGASRGTFGDMRLVPAGTGLVNFADETSGGHAVAHRITTPVGGWNAASVNIGGFATGYRTRMIEILAPAWPDTTYYINPSSGNNANNGTSPSTPWASYSPSWGTLSPGDRVLLEGGSTLNGDMIWNTVSGTAAKPIVFGAYGLGGKPRVIAWADTNAVYCEDVSYVTIQDIRFSGHATSPVNYGINFWLTGTNARAGIKLLNLDVDAFANFGIFVGGNSGAKYDDVLIDGCLAYANGDAGITTWSGDDTLAVRHTNVTISNCVTRDNLGISTATSNSGSGIILGYVDGATISNCLAHGNGGSNNPSVAEAGFGIWTYASNAVTITRCEAHSNRSASNRDGGGFDLDERCTNCVIEYCYSFDNDGPGIMLWHQNTGTWSGNVVRFNISEKDSKKHSDGSLYVSHAAGVIMGSAEVHHNLFYADGKPAFHFHNAPSTILVRNNIFYSIGATILGDGTVSTEPQMRNNAYWHPTTFQLRWGATTYTNLADWRLDFGQETANGLWNGPPLGYEADPMLNAVGDVGIINQAYPLSNIASYRLSASSPLAGTGLIFDPGVTTDFFGLAVIAANQNSVGPHNIVSNAPPAGQTITLTGFVNSNQFGSLVLTHSVQPAGFANTSMFGTVSLTHTIEMTGLGNMSAFGAPSLSVGVATQQITLTGLGNVSSLGTVRLDQQIRLTALGITTQFGSPSLTRPELVELTGFANLNTFGSPQLNQVVSPIGLAPQSAFGNLILEQAIDLSGIVSTTVFGSPQLNHSIKPYSVFPGSGLGQVRLTQSLTPTGLVSSNAFGTLQLTQTISLTGWANGSLFGVLSLERAELLSPEGFVNTTLFGTPRIEQSLSPIGIIAQNQFGTLAINPGLRPVALSHTTSFGVLTLTSTIEMAGLGSSTVLGTLQLNQTVNLTGLASSDGLGAPVLSQSVEPASLINSSGIGDLSLRQSLVLEGVSSGSALGTVILHQQIRPTGLASNTTFGSLLVNFASDVVLAPVTIGSTLIFGTPTLSQMMAPASVENDSLFGNLRLALTITAAGIASQNEIGSFRLVQNLAPQGLGSVSGFGNLSLLRAGLLGIEGVGSTSALGMPALNPGLRLDGLMNLSGLGELHLFVGDPPQIIQTEGNPVRNRFGHLAINYGMVLQGVENASAVGTPTLERLPHLAVLPVSGLAYFGEDAIQALYLGEDKVDRAYMGHVCIWPLNSVPFNFPTNAEAADIEKVNIQWGAGRPLTPEEAALIPPVPPHTTLAWWRADDPDAILLHEGKVHGWKDSMYGITLSQTDPARRPTYEPTAFGGTPGVRFQSGLQQFLELWETPWPIGRNDVYMLVVIDQLAPPSNPADQSIVAYGYTPVGQRKVQRKVVLGYNRCAIAFGNGFTEYPHMHQPVLYWGRHAAITWMGDVSASLGVNGIFAGILTQALRTEAGVTRMGADAASTVPGEFADCIVRDVLFGSSAAMSARHWDDLKRWVLQRSQIDFFDDFVRIEEDLEKHPMWVLESGTPGILRVVNNKMVQEVNGPVDSLYLSPDVQDPDQYVQAKLVAPATVTDSPIIALRIQDRDNFACGMRLENGTVRLVQATGGAIQTLGTPVPYGYGDIFRLAAQGTQFQLYRNGEPVLGPFSITTFQTNTRTGVRAGSMAVPFLDNYENAR